MLFGPAYKGITLASSTAVALAHAGRNVPFAFNRKEARTTARAARWSARAARGPRGHRRRRDLGGHLGARVGRADPRAGRDARRGADRARPPGARRHRRRADRDLGHAGGRAALRHPGAVDRVAGGPARLPRRGRRGGGAPRRAPRGDRGRTARGTASRAADGPGPGAPAGAAAHQYSTAAAGSRSFIARGSSGAATHGPGRCAARSVQYSASGIGSDPDRRLQHVEAAEVAADERERLGHRRDQVGLADQEGHVIRFRVRSTMRRATPTSRSVPRRAAARGRRPPVRCGRPARRPGR